MAFFFSVFRQFHMVRNSTSWTTEKYDNIDISFEINGKDFKIEIY